MVGRRILGAAPLALLMGALPVAAQCELLRYTLDDAEENEFFGRSLDLEGDRACVVAPGMSNPTPHLGGVFVLDRVGGTWMTTAELVPAGALSGVLGEAALSGDTILVLAPLQSDSILLQGAAYFFGRGPNGWAQTGVHFGSQLAEYLGGTVDVDGDTAMVGGATGISVFERVGHAWTLQEVLHGQFAWLRGDVALAGSSNGSGVRVYERSGSTWVQVDLLVGSDTVPGDGFGARISYDGATALVLAPGHDGAGTDLGAVYVFEENASGWSETQKLLPPEPAQAGFGSVAHDGTLAVIGQKPTSIQPFPPGEAYAYVYERSATGWSLREEIQPLGGSDGGGIAVDGDAALLGMPTAGADEGSVSFWSLTGLGCPPLFAVPPALSVQAGGSHFMKLIAGPAEALRPYLVVGSASGTSPGQRADGLTVPLNLDGYYLFTLLHPNTLIAGSLGLFDADGEATAELALPAGLSPSLAGLSLHHAYVVVELPGSGKLTFASGATELLLAP